MRSLLRSLFAFLLCATLVTAQEKASRTRPPDLSLAAVGRQHHPIQTKSTLAQQYFDQGLTLLYGLNHDEAVRSFQRAAELDPASPMPLWGIAFAVGPNYNMDVDAEKEKTGFETMQRAQKLAANAPQVEQNYVAALLTRYSSDATPDYKRLSRDYASAMKSLSEKYPDDLDAATLYAESLMDLNPWKLWTNDGKPTENTEEIVRVLESVLARDPNHAGANHYYIHAVEASTEPYRALPSAHRLETLVPDAGHLVHMPGHIYLRTGDFDAAARGSAKAAKIDRVYIENTGQAGSFYDHMYHSHNEHFVVMAASMAGRYAEAKKAADAIYARSLPHAKIMPMLEVYLLTPIWIDVRFNKWTAVLSRPEPPKKLAVTHVMWRYSRALAFVATGKLSDAEQERSLFKTETAAFAPDAMFGQQNTARTALPLAEHIIEARIAAASGRKDEAISHWQKAVEIQDSLFYTEPADWYYPVRESLGAALVALGNSAEAEKVFRADLQQNPRNPRSLFGLLECLRLQKRDTDAAWVEKQFHAAWKRSDTKLTLEAL